MTAASRSDLSRGSRLRSDVTALASLPPSSSGEHLGEEQGQDIKKKN